MFLIYEGPHLEVEVPHDDGSYDGAVLTAVRGKAVEVPDDVAASLLSQGEDQPDEAEGREPQHNRTWRKATASEAKSAQRTAETAATDGNSGEQSQGASHDDVSERGDD